MKKKVISLTLGLIFVLQMILTSGLVFASGAPEVVSVTPSGDNVEKAAVVKITFSTAMDRSTLTSENIVITDMWDDVITPTAASAYDKEYVITADFATETEYYITVSTAVKSAEGVPMAEEYEHYFMTGEGIRGIENVTPDVSGFTYKAGGLSGELSAVCDGRYDTGMNTYGGTAPAYITADLGKAQDIAYIEYCGNAAFQVEDNAKNMKILVSNDIENGPWTELAMTPELSSGAKPGALKWIAVNETGEKFRYVRLTKDGKTIYVIEVDVYAYEAAPEVVSVTPSGTDISKAQAGQVTFSTAMDRSTLTSENIVIKDMTTGTVVTPDNTSAFDKSFAFTYDFAANTTYQITVSNVKSAAGLSVSEYVHTFKTGKGVYGIENVTPGVSGFTYKEGAQLSGELSAACDGRYDTGMNTYGGTAPAYITADLGKAQDIAYIEYCGNAAFQVEDNAKNMKILVSNDIENGPWTELAMTPELSSGAKPGALKWIAVNETGEKFRYVRLTKDGKNIYVIEVDVYAYEAAPEVVSVTPSGTDISKAQAGQVTFSTAMDRSTLTSENIVIKDMTTGTVVTPDNTSAFDKSFAFTYDFAANTTYQITVSNVKSAAGLSVSEYVHTFKTGKGVYGIENVTPGVSGFTYKEGAQLSGELSAVCDGRYDTGMNTYGGTAPAYITADLGKAQDIAYIEYCGNAAFQVEGNAKNMKILVSNDIENGPWTELAMTPELSSEAKPGALKWIAVNETGEKFRYVRLTKDGKNIYVIEVDVYAYEAAPEVVSVTPSGTDISKAQAGQVTFSTAMDRSTLTSENIVIKDMTTGTVVTPDNTSAFDKSFAFTYDFAANTTYQITVSNVKSAAGLSVPEYVHTFTTAWTAPVKNVTPDVSGFTYKEGLRLSGELSAVCDGRYDTGMNTYSGTAPAYITADLGKAEDIAYIEYCGNKATEAEGNAKNIKILVSNDIENGPWTELTVTPALSSEAKPGALKWIAVNETGENFRYVRLTKDGTVIYAVELGIYAYEPKINELTADDIDQISKTEEYTVNGSAMYGAVASGESVTYMVDITKITETAEAPKVCGAVYGYNENNNRVLVSISEAKVKGDVYTVTATIPKTLENAEVNFFVWDGEQTPILGKIVESNLK